MALPATTRIGLQGTSGLTWSDLRAHRRLRAMNTDVEIVVCEPHFAPLLDDAARWLQEFERRFSRFLPQSELSRFNARDASEVRISTDLAELLMLARRFHRSTGGVFDPAVLPQLEAAGYDRSFEQIEASDERVADADRNSIVNVTIDAAARVAHAPEGLRIDLGGIGKGYAVDRMAKWLAPSADFLINAGGDIYAGGRTADGDGWYAGVADPGSPERNLTLVWLRDRALATSTTSVRRWHRGGTLQHHIIDPRTGRAAASDVISASVIAPTAVEADVYAKTALILGSRAGRAFLEQQQLPGFFVLADGSAAMTADWPGEPVT